VHNRGRERVFLIINTMNKKNLKYFTYFILILFILIIIFLKFFSMPKESDIDWLEANYQFIIDSSREEISAPISAYIGTGEIPHEVNEVCKNLVCKNIRYFDRISVRIKADGTSSVLVKTWPNYYIYKNNRSEQPRIALPIVKTYKGWVVINNRRD
jgi:preprotein translocase subunit SecG